MIHIYRELSQVVPFTVIRDIDFLIRPAQGSLPCQSLELAFHSAKCGKIREVIIG